LIYFVLLFSTGGASQVKRLQKTAVPCIFPWTKEPVNDSGRAKRRCKRHRTNEASTTSTSEVLVQVMPDILDIGEQCEVYTEVVDTTTFTTAPAWTQTDGPSPTVSTTDTATDPVHFPTFSVRKFENDPDGIHCFTGLATYQKFMFVLCTLGQAAHQLSYMYGPVKDTISVPDRFFLVLIKLRKHYSNFELSRLFEVSESDVYNIFCTWIKFMSLQWREVPLWVSRDLVRFFSPSGFKEHYPTTRAIIDGTECPVRKPKFPTAQQSTFSTYKNRNTVKVLAGISPGGLIICHQPLGAQPAIDRLWKGQLCQRCATLGTP